MNLPRSGFVEVNAKFGDRGLSAANIRALQGFLASKLELITPKPTFN
jgi:hypothetical protein